MRPCLRVCALSLPIFCVAALAPGQVSSPPKADRTHGEDEPLQNCRALTLTAKQDLPPYGELAISRDGKTLAFLVSASNKSEVHFVDREDKTEGIVSLAAGGTARTHFASTPKLGFSPDGNWLTVAEGSHLWGVSVPGGKILFDFSLASEPSQFFGRLSISNISVAAEVRELNAHVDSLHRILLLDREGERQKSYTAASLSSDYIRGLTLSPEGKLLALLTDNGKNRQSKILILDSTGSLVREIHVSQSSDIRWLANGRTLLIKGSRLEEIDTRTGKSVNKLTEHLNWVEDPMYSGNTLEADPTDKYVAALFYHYNPVTRFFDMGPEDPGWEFRLYQRGTDHALCRHKWDATSMMLASNQTLIAIRTEQVFARKPPQQRRIAFIYRISNSGH